MSLNDLMISYGLDPVAVAIESAAFADRLLGMNDPLISALGELFNL